MGVREERKRRKKRKREGREGGERGEATKKEIHSQTCKCSDVISLKFNEAVISIFVNFMFRRTAATAYGGILAV